VATTEEDRLNFRWHVAHFMLVVVGQGSVLAWRSLPATLHSLDMVECDSFRLAATIGMMLSFHAGGG